MAIEQDNQTPDHAYPEVILPVTMAVVDDLLDSQERKTWFKAAPRLHLACIYLLGMVPKLSSKPDKAPQVIQSALNDLLKQLDTPTALSEFREMAAHSFNESAVREGVRLLPQLGIDLKSPKEWDVPSPVNPDGTLNGDFNSEIVNRRLGKTFFTDDPLLRDLGLNTKQTRIATAILGDPEEPIHVQGFAGTGKTHMIRGMIQALPRAHTAILAKTAGQLQAMMSDPALRDVHHFLFGQLAKQHLVAGGISPKILNDDTTRATYNVSDETIALNMGFHPIGYLTGDQVSKAVRSVLFQFCESTDSTVNESHLSYAHQRLSPIEKKQLLQFTQQYWDNLVSLESTERWQPVRHYHLIKWASMVPKSDTDKLRITEDGFEPLDLKFAIVDEAHDLTPALAKLLDRLEVAVYSLGDTFQRIQGVPPSIGGSTLHREMELSMRAGEGIGRIINPVLEAHPRFQNMEPLKGSKDLKTHCHFYQTRRIPQTPYAILCGSNFHVFEYLHQLVNEGASVSLLPGTSFGFQDFAESLIRLRHGYRGRSPELFRFKDWDALARTYGRMQVFSKIEKMFEKGYSEQDFKNVMAKVMPIGRAHYTLGRAEDSKNWQFPNVMLSPELFTPDRSADYVANNLSKVYLAASRAQRSIALPASFDGWVDNERSVLQSNKKKT